MNLSAGERAMRIARLKALVVEDSVSIDESSLGFASYQKPSGTNEILDKKVQSCDSVRSSIRQPKYSSSASSSMAQKQSFGRSSRRRGKKKDQATSGKSSFKGRLSRVSDSVVCMAHVAGFPPRESRQDERWRNGNRGRQDYSRDDCEVSIADSTSTKKVAFFLDLFADEVGEQIHRDDGKDIPNAERTSLPCKGTIQRSEGTEDPRYERFIAQNTYPISAGISRRMHTNALALVESINEDAGVWLGLRSDSYVDAPVYYEI